MLKAAWWVTAAGLVAVVPAVGWAQQGTADVLAGLSKAQREVLLGLLTAGNAAFDRGDYAAARDAYVRADAIVGLARVSQRLAMCHEKLGEKAQAVEAYTKYLALAPQAKDRARVEGEVARLRQEIAAQQIGRLELVVTPPGAQVRVVGLRELGAAPVKAELPVGSYTVTIRAKGYHEASQAVVIKAAQTTSLTVALEALPTLRVEVVPKGAQVTILRSEKAPPEPLGPAPVVAQVSPGAVDVLAEAPGYKPGRERVTIPRSQDVRLQLRLEPVPRPGSARAFGHVGLIVGGVAALGAGGAWLVARDKIQDANAYDRGDLGNTRATLVDMEASARRWRTTARVTGGVAAGFLILGGAVLWRSHSEDAQVGLGVGAAGGGHATVRVRF